MKKRLCDPFDDDYKEMVDGMSLDRMQEIANLNHTPHVGEPDEWTGTGGGIINFQLHDYLIMKYGIHPSN